MLVVSISVAVEMAVGMGEALGGLLSLDNRGIKGKKIRKMNGVIF